MKVLNKIIKALGKNSIYLVLFLHSLIHLSNIHLIGTYWDDLGYINTSQIIVDKVGIYFKDFNNLFLGEFNYNFEFYGFLFPLIIFLLTKFQFLSESLILFLNKFFGFVPLTNLDQQNTLRFFYFYIIMLIILFFLLINYSQITSKQNSLLFIVFLLLTPTFNGHLFFNIKDVPFALIYFLSSIYVLKEKKLFTSNFKNNLQSNFILSILFSSLTLIRFSGIIFIGFLIFNYFFLYKVKVTIKHFYNLIFVALLTGLLCFLFTPSSWRYPLKWIWGAIETQFFLDWGGLVLTNGEYLDMANLPPNYLLTWFFYQLPWPYISLLVFGAFLLLKRFKNLDVFTKFSLIFIFTIFTFFFLTTPIAYDGIRQYLFLIPFIIHIVSIAYSNLDNKVKNKFIKSFVFVFIISNLVYTQYSLYPYTYFYYNEFVDEDKITIDCEKISGCGDWETDYWGVSGKAIVMNTKSLVSDNKKIFSCNPSQVFTDYYTTENAVDRKNRFYVFTLHRPAPEGSLCDNNLKKYEEQDLLKSENCQTIYTEKRKLRNDYINLSYLLECNINY